MIINTIRTQKPSRVGECYFTSARVKGSDCIQRSLINNFLRAKNLIYPVVKRNEEWVWLTIWYFCNSFSFISDHVNMGLLDFRKKPGPKERWIDMDFAKPYWQKEISPVAPFSSCTSQTFKKHISSLHS